MCPRLNKNHVQKNEIKNEKFQLSISVSLIKTDKIK